MKTKTLEEMRLGSALCGLRQRQKRFSCNDVMTPGLFYFSFHVQAPLRLNLKSLKLFVVFLNREIESFLFCLG